jgi:general nucleoside transport system ATP-binding protein
VKVRLSGLSKSFPGVRAVDDVSLEYEPGKLYALVGENGAGKSTLMKLLYGMLPPDAGSISLDGTSLRFKSPQDAIARGIGMVHQHFMLVDTLSAAENVILGAEPLKGGLIDRAAARKAVQGYADHFHLDVDPDAPMESLSVGEAQRVEILKVLYRGADFLIFDEPTGVLTPQESRFLFEILRRFTAEGKTVVLITHKLDEVLELADEVDVMRRGRYVGRVSREDASAEGLARMMVGREVLFRVEKGESKPGAPILELDDIQLDAAPGQRGLENLSFAIREGEIFGIAGVEGNGQRELAGIVTGLIQSGGGRLLFGNETLEKLTPSSAREMGIAHVPEDRQKTGLVLDMDLGENLMLGQEGDADIGRGGLLSPSRIRRRGQERVSRFDLRAADLGQAARELSGGNQQKLILARELAREPSLLVASQPTRGVDVGAIEAIHRILIERRDLGMAVLLFSSELTELLALSDRIGVLYRGRLTAVLDAEGCDEEELGLWITGAKGGIDVA